LRIAVTGRHLDVTEATKQYVEEKVAKLDRYFWGIKSIGVTISTEGDLHQVELIVSNSHSTDVIARAQAKGVCAAIDAAIDKAERQLTRVKEKIADKKRKHLSESGLPAEEEDIVDENSW